MDNTLVPPRAIQFNLDLTSTAPEAKNLVDFLYESAVKDRYASRPGGQTEVNARNAALVVLLNLFQAWKWDAESPGVSYAPCGGAGFSSSFAKGNPRLFR